MNVLVACEESQRVCTAFRERGHRAFSCDILDCSGGHPEWHIKGDVLPLLNGNCTFETADGEKHSQEGTWDLLIAHPPCTFLLKAGARWLYKRIQGERFINEKRYENLKRARNFFFRIAQADCEKICIENPRPLKICELPPPTQIIQPYQFGEPYSKETLLWLKNLSKLKESLVIEHYSPWTPSNTGALSKGGGGATGEVHNAIDRSKTFVGVARAMAEQWG